MLTASRFITLRPALPGWRRFFQTTAGVASDVGRPFLLYTAGTPNGRKASVFLEELRAAYYGVDYEWVFFFLSFLKSVVPRSLGVFWGYWGTLGSGAKCGGIHRTGDLTRSSSQRSATSNWLAIIFFFM